MSCNDPLQTFATFFMITSQVAETNIQAHTLLFTCQFLLYPHLAHFMELKVIIHHIISRPNDPMLIFGCFTISSTTTLLFRRISSLVIPSFSAVSAVVRHSCTLHRLHWYGHFLNTSIHSYTTPEQAMSLY